MMFVTVSMLVMLSPVADAQEVIGFGLFDQGRLQQQQCDKSNPCSDGMTCAYSDTISGIKVCVDRDESSIAPRKGVRCPLVAEMPPALVGNSFGPSSFFGSASGYCSFDIDCEEGKRCCQRPSENTRECMESKEISAEPRVTVLIDGKKSVDNAPSFYEYSASTSLVQSNGFNVIFDSGSVLNRIPLINALRDNVGLFLEDIDLIVSSHGHVDHIGNIGLFPDIPNDIEGFLAQGNKFYPTLLHGAELYDSGLAPYLVNDDKNMQLIPTPGHTLKDSTLVVYNVPDLGTVSLVGDLIVAEQEAHQTEVTRKDGYQNPEWANKSRSTIICLSDHIVPGHGPMFKVTSDLKNKYSCK